MNVLFLCRANAFRSQIAEAFFNKYSKKNRAESAALVQANPIPSSFVIKAMKDKEIDVSKKFPKNVNSKMLEKADLIVVMHSDLKSFIPLQFIKKTEFWRVQDIIVKEDNEYFYSKFIKAREVIEGEVKKLIERIG
jgi:protein-tyrosine-phosphatase